MFTPARAQIGREAHALIALRSVALKTRWDRRHVAACNSLLGLNPTHILAWLRPLGVGLALTSACLLAQDEAKIGPEPGRSLNSFEWGTATPESQGFSTPRLDTLLTHLSEHGTKAFLLIRDDKIVYEWYAPGHSATKPHYSASMAKALVGGMAVAVTLSDGRLALDDPAAKFIPQWRSDPIKSHITLRHLGSHTSGLADSVEPDGSKDKMSSWKAEFWKRKAPPRDPFTLSRDEAPLLFVPGKGYQYSNPGIAMLAYATTAALKAAPEKDLRSLVRDRVMRPIGVADEAWSMGYKETIKVDGLPLVPAWGGGAYTARASARIARLVLREGDWEGKQLLKPEAVRAVTSDAGLPGMIGIGWWSNNDGMIACLPRDAYFAVGVQVQIVLVIPSSKIIAVRSGQEMSKTDSFDVASELYFLQPLMAALGMDGPQADPPVIFSSDPMMEAVKTDHMGHKSDQEKRN